MANMIPLIKSGGFFASRYWTPLVIGNGLTTTGGDTPDPPVQKTVSGSIIHITDALAAPAVALSAAINPVQSGSGDPSPTNVRPISGHSAANIVVSPTLDAQDGTTYTVSFGAAGTVYGGTLDVVNGTLTVEWAIVDLGTLSWLTSSQNFFYSTITGKKAGFTNLICSNYKTKERSTWASDEVAISGNRTTGQIYIRDGALSGKTAAEFKTAMSGVQLVYELDTTQTYTLTPTEVQLLLGENNIWADTGDSTLTYLADGRVDSLTALNMLLGGAYTPSADVSDREALQIIMGDTT